MKFEHPLTVSITVFSEEQLTAVYALLAGVSLAPALLAAANAPKAPVASPTAAAPTPAVEPSGSDAAASQGADDSAGEVEIDAHGWPWSPDMHASTKGVTKEGLWRMKVGVSRPEPKPGFPKTDGANAGAAAAASPTPSPSPSASDAGAAAASAAAPSSDFEEDDEFAAFRQADEASGTAAAPVARTWTDADLSKLCNQAAAKLGNPQPVKDVIAKFVPEGEVPHSRNIPEAKREEFAQDIEKTADIQFAG